MHRHRYTEYRRFPDAALREEGGDDCHPASCIRIVERAEDGVPFRVWKSASVLCDWLEHQAQLEVPSLGSCRGRTVLELGSGCGLVGILCSHLGAEVVLTDKAEVLEHTRENAELNPLPDARTVPVLELKWGADLADRFTRGSFDMVIGSDLIYHEELRRPLLLSLLQLVGPHTVIILASASRNGEPHESWQSDFIKYFEIEALADWKPPVSIEENSNGDGRSSRSKHRPIAPPQNLEEDEAKWPVTIFHLRLRTPPPSEDEVRELLDDPIGQALVARSAAETRRCMRNRDAVCLLPEMGDGEDLIHMQPNGTRVVTSEVSCSQACLLGWRRLLGWKRTCA